MQLLRQQVEALIFCSEQSISIDEIAASLKLSFDWDLSDDEIIRAIEEIKEKYSSDEFSFELAEISEGYQFLTKKQYHAAIGALIQHKAKKKLSVSQMETLAIIAYRQPISKAEVEHIRGVSCDYAIQKLLEKELVEISGKSEGPGRPILYSVSQTFTDYFGIRSVKDLPQLKDLHVEQNEIGQSGDMLDGAQEEVPATDEPVVVNESPVATDAELIVEKEEETRAGQADPEDPEMDGEEEEQIQIPDRKTIFLDEEKSSHEEEPEKERGSLDELN
jgi:segregation and condensation protein B